MEGREIVLPKPPPWPNPSIASTQSPSQEVAYLLALNGNARHHCQQPRHALLLNAHLIKPRLVAVDKPGIAHLLSVCLKFVIGNLLFTLRHPPNHKQRKPSKRPSAKPQIHALTHHKPSCGLIWDPTNMIFTLFKEYLHYSRKLLLGTGPLLLGASPYFAGKYSRGTVTLQPDL